MIYNGKDAERKTALAVAERMATAAKTAPKGCGVDNVIAVIVDGDDKKILSAHMRDIGKETGVPIFERDANNVDNSHAVVLIGTEDKPLLLEQCGLCGFENCKESVKAGAKCAFNVTDLGIAIGSAVSIAADHRIDNRVMYTVGKAALRMDCFPKNVRICYGIPLSTSSKSIFFDRDPGSVLL